MNNPPRLLDQVAEKIRLKHYRAKTDQAYARWIKRYILFHGKQHPKDMGALGLTKGAASQYFLVDEC